MTTGRNNLRKRGSTWTYYLYVTEGDGTRRQVSKGGFATRKQAETARAEALTAMSTGSWVRPDRLTVVEFLSDEWLPTQRPPTLEESTYASYSRNTRLHVAPYIGGIRLQELTPMDLNSLYRKLLESGRRPSGIPARQHDPAVLDLIDRLKGEGNTWQQVADAVGEAFPHQAGITRDAVAAAHRRAQQPKPAPKTPGLSNRTVRYVHTIIHAALRDAMRWNRVTRNVADAATPPPETSTRRGRHTTWTGEQLGRFLDFVADSPYLPAWLYLATSGSRRGEVLGLKWVDVNLDDATAIMSRQICMVDHLVVIKDLPKTKGGHTIALDPGTVAMLRDLQVRQAELKRMLGASYHDDGWIFCRPDGTPIHPERFSREFLRKQEAHNKAHPDELLPRLKLHGLRHTWATLALEDGIDIHVVSDRLDHSSIHITSQIYTHVRRPLQSDAANRVAARIFARTPAKDVVCDMPTSTPVPSSEVR
jgi:integrase